MEETRILHIDKWQGNKWSSSPSKWVRDYDEEVTVKVTPKRLTITSLRFKGHTYDRQTGRRIGELKTNTFSRSYFDPEPETKPEEELDFVEPETRSVTIELTKDNAEDIQTITNALRVNAIPNLDQNHYELMRKILLQVGKVFKISQRS